VNHTKGLRPVPMVTVLSHTIGLSYLWEGDYSWPMAAPVMAYMLLGIAALFLAGGWLDGARVAWAVHTGPKRRPHRIRRRTLTG
jgi:hypothetical protein